MKMLQIILLVMVIALLWRKARGAPAAAPKPPATPVQPQLMQVCAQCGVHLPVNEAIAGRNGIYCCAAHRAQGER